MTHRYLHKKIAFILALSLMLTATGIKSYALSEWKDDCYTLAEGACLIDGDSKEIIYAKDEHSPYYPASITKVLTALITIENCPNLSEQVEFSYDAVHIEEENSTIIGASEGDRLSVLDCLYSLLFQSANEVANALAEHVGAKHPELKEKGENDRAVFVKMMNDKAASLGCMDSHFNNPSGLTDEKHYTSAYDMCLIMAEAIKNETFLDIESHTYWKHAPIKKYPNADDPLNTVYPKHNMLKKRSNMYYEGTIAGKTGFTSNAGNTLLTAVRRGDMTLISCVLNAHQNHYNDTIRLMDFGFDNFKSLRLTDYNSVNSDVTKDFAIEGVSLVDSYTLMFPTDAKVTIPKEGDFSELTLNLEKSNNEGEAVFSYGEKEAGRVKLSLAKISSKDKIYTDAAEDELLSSILGIKTDKKNDDTNSESSSTGDTQETTYSREVIEESSATDESLSKAESPLIVEGETESTIETENTEVASNVEESNKEDTKPNKALAIILKAVLFTVGLLTVIAIVRLIRDNKRKHTLNKNKERHKSKDQRYH